MPDETPLNRQDSLAVEDDVLQEAAADIGRLSVTGSQVNSPAPIIEEIWIENVSRADPPRGPILTAKTEFLVFIGIRPLGSRTGVQPLAESAPLVPNGPSQCRVAEDSLGKNAPETKAKRRIKDAQASIWVGVPEAYKHCLDTIRQVARGY
jgi:hypothetical protein